MQRAMETACCKGWFRRGHYINQVVASKAEFTLFHCGWSLRVIHEKKVVLILVLFAIILQSERVKLNFTGNYSSTRLLSACEPALRRTPRRLNGINAALFLLAVNYTMPSRPFNCTYVSSMSLYVNSIWME